MADVQGQLPVPVETEHTHTPSDPHAQILANAQAHAEELSQRRCHQPPPTAALLGCHSTLAARGVTGGAQARTRQVQQAIVTDANSLPQFA